jgi:hypothetical protein
VKTIESLRVVEASRHDPENQWVNNQPLVLEDGGGISMFPVKLRDIAV